MTTVQLRCLGEVEIETERTKLGPDAAVMFGAALYFAIERGKRVPRDYITELMWPDVKDVRHARHRFRQTLVRLKGAAIPLVVERNHVRLDRDVVESDLDQVLNVAPDEVAASLLARRSYEFLPGYAPKFSQPFARWVEDQRMRAHAAIQRLFIHALQAAKMRGDWPAAEQIAAECLRLDPFNEEATITRAEAAVMRGSKVQALAILDTYMEGLGDKSAALSLPAKTLRSRIAERFNEPKYAVISEKYFVGREEEMQQLTQAMRGVKQGHGAAYSISGPPGIGKTRLAQELANLATIEGFQVVTAKCQATDEQRAMSLFATIATPLRSLPGGLGCSPETVELLQVLAGERPAPENRRREDAQFLHADIRRAILDVLDAVTEESPLLLIVEDTHWLDKWSWEVLGDVIRWGVPHKLCVLLTTRPCEHPKGDQRELRHVTLRPLSPEASIGLINEVLIDQVSEVADSVATWWAEISEGNPFFVREILASWLETNDEHAIPPSLKGLIERRVSALTPDALRVLQVAALLGRFSALERIEAASHIDARSLLDAIVELDARGLVVRSPEGVAPGHELIASVVRQSLPGVATQLLHRQIAQSLHTELRNTKSPDLAWECAQHWRHAEDSTTANAVLAEWGEYLVQVGLADDAIGLYQRALSTDRHPVGRVRLMRGLVHAAELGGSWDLVLTTTGELEKLECEAEVNGRHTEEELAQFEALVRTWRSPEIVIARTRECITNESCAVDHRLTAAFWHLAVLGNLGVWEAGADVWPLINRLVSNPAATPWRALYVRMLQEVESGDIVKGVQWADELVTLCRERETQFTLMRVLRNAAVTYRAAGMIPRALASAREVFEIASRYQATPYALDAATVSTLINLQMGNVPDAAHWMAFLDDVPRPLHTYFWGADLLIARIRIAAARDDLEAVAAVPPLDTHAPSQEGERPNTIALSISTGELFRSLVLRLKPDEWRFSEALRIWPGKEHRLTHDFDAFVLASVYVRLGLEAEALALIQGRLSARRERGCVLPELTQLSYQLQTRTRE